MTLFLDLPREVRDMIYKEYVFVEGGYILDFDSNTLRCADNKPIDLALMLTCKSVAKEMKGIALSSNTLNFSTFFSNKHRTVAGRFDLMIKVLHRERERRIYLLRPDVLSLPQDVAGELAEAHPKFAPYLDVIKDKNTGDWRDNVGPPGSCGETPSVFRKFVHSVLHTIVSQEHHFDAEQLDQFETYENFYNTRLERLVNANPDPWAIPNSEDLENMISASSLRLEIDDDWHENVRGQQLSQVRHRYSAAAVAIRFLGSLSKDSRSSIRSIVLNEDSIAVAYAECHGLGLIPYCLENPRLRVERRVSMWRTVFQTKTVNEMRRMGPYEGDTLHADEVSHPVAVWILEALELESAGMPPGSFKLIFDGDWTCSKLFHSVVQRDAAWQAAIDLCIERKILPPLSWDLRRRDTRNRPGFPDETSQQDGNKWYIFEAFPQAIQDIVAGTSSVKCNFGLSKAWEVESLVEKNKAWTFDEWKTGWYTREQQTFEPDPPSPSWLQLLCENTMEAGLPVPLNEAPFRYSLRMY